MSEPTWSVEVEDLIKRFGDFTAVDRVTFQVSPGEIFGFLGSNGAGKSTTIRMLCGLLRPSGGTATVAGYDVYTESERIKQNIGYMSQKFSLYDGLTVEENIDFFSGIYGVPTRERRSNKDRVLQMAGLEARRESPTRLLPGGWKQRLALGCAVLHRPPILFLDEPTSGVDPQARREFWALIYELSDAGHTIFVTTHYMDEAEYCHRLALMHDGRIIALDHPAALRQAHRAHRLLHLECPQLLEALQTVETLEEVTDAGFFGGGLQLLVADREAAGRAVTWALEARGIPVERLEPVEPTMEDVFTSMIREQEAAK